MEEVPWLTAREERMWRLLAAVIVLLPDVVETQLQREGGLTQFGYGVLSALSEAPDRSLRMTELARLAYGSRSRLSHAMASLERRGLVRRERAADDARGSVAVLTDAGYATVAAVAPEHVRVVRSAVFDPLNDRQVDALEEICRELLSGRTRDGTPAAPGTDEHVKTGHHFDDTRRPHHEDTEARPASDARERLRATVRRAPSEDPSGDRSGDRPRDAGPADAGGLLSGLALVSEARGEVDLTELHLIDRARAQGHTWEQIADALGMPDRRQAQTRFRRLRARWPEFELTSQPSAPN